MPVGKKPIKVLNIVGARPNFMKMAPLFRAHKKNKRIHPLLVHTNQHSGEKMSDIFFKTLGLPEPDYSIPPHKGSPLSTIAHIAASLEPILEKEQPDLVVLVGDVNSTLAGAIAANKMGIPIAHVEAGLRSGDRTMPEEINRIVVDHISDLLFVTEKSGMDNLEKEGVAKNRTFFVGNTMIDNLIHMLPNIRSSNILSSLGVSKGNYIVMTMHRPVNVDSEKSLKKIVSLIEKIVRTSGLTIVFPIHPRALNNLKKKGLHKQLTKTKKLILTEPLGYRDFLKLVSESALVITDSGGIQEEATHLKIPIVTLRDSTERPSTIYSGANSLHSLDEQSKTLAGISAKMKMKRGAIKDLPLNDGRASERIVRIISRHFKK